MQIEFLTFIWVPAVGENESNEETYYPLYYTMFH